jgi:hypothetical protein
MYVPYVLTTYNTWHHMDRTVKGISLISNNLLIFVVVKCCVFFEVRFTFWNIIFTSFDLGKPWRILYSLACLTAG